VIFLGNFIDAWKQLRPQVADTTEGWTYTTLQQEPKKRIDFILYRNSKHSSNNMEHNNGQLQPTSIEVLADTAVKASDHRGLHATFHFSPQSHQDQYLQHHIRIDTSAHAADVNRQKPTVGAVH
jgi:hypothetical protein